MSDIPAALFFEAPPPTPDTFNVLLYGPPKTGKTRAAGTAPGPILYINCEGPDAIWPARVAAGERGTRIEETRIGTGADGEDVTGKLAALRALITERHDKIGTVVVDTLGKLRDALIRQLVVKNAKDSLKQYGMVSDEMKDFVLFLRDAPVNVVLLAHEEILDEGNGVIPLVSAKVAQFMAGEVGVIGYTGKVAREDGTVEYLASFSGAGGRYGGDRSSALGQVRTMDLTEWLGLYRAALTPVDVDIFLPEEPEAASDDVPIAPEKPARKTSKDTEEAAA